MAAVIKLPHQGSGPESTELAAANAPNEAGAEAATEAEAENPAPAEAVHPPRTTNHQRAVTITLAVYLGLHLIAGLSALWVLHARGEALTKFVHQGWDSAFYLGIARDGYHKSTDYAFFPLYPALVRAVEAVTGLSFNRAGVLTSVLSGSAAAVGIRYVGEKVAGNRAGLVLVALWAVVPSAVIQVWPYADGLFVAFAAWALYALLRRAWVAAGVLTLLGGLTRPSASALIAAVGLFALVAVIRREDGWRPWVCAAVAPLGMLGYVLAVGHHFGQLTAYFRLQHDAWANWIDGGKTTYRDITALFDGRVDNPPVMYLLAVVTMVAVPFLLVLAYRQRQPWPLLVFSGVLAALILCSHRQGFVVPRELMPAFPLLLPLAQVLARARTRGLIVAFVVIAAMSGWYAWFIPLTYGAP